KLTNGYIRRSRRRFWKAGLEGDKAAACATLYTVLTNFCQALAPFMPFVPEHIFRNLTGQESVHLSDFPDFALFPDEPKLREEFAVLDTVITLGLSLRADEQIKVRQPLQKVEIYLPSKFARKILTENEEV